MQRFLPDSHLVRNQNPAAMKKITTCVFFSLIVITSLSAQSRSFQAFRDKFSGAENVHHFSTNGFFARAILWMTTADEFDNAIKSIRSISLMTVPKSLFREREVSVSGFKTVLSDDSFDELGRVRDHGDHVTLYMKTTQSKNNRYIFLIEEPGEVVLIEMTGYIDPRILLDNSSFSFSDKQKI